MTTSSEQRDAQAPLGAAWRSQTERVQAAALPREDIVVSCPAPFGHGGLGRHLQEIAAAAQRGGRSVSLLCEDGGEPHDAVEHLSPQARWRVAMSLARARPALRAWASGAGFDAAAARGLPAGAHLISFNGTSLAQFRASRAARFESLSLVAANPHMRHVLRQHALAHSQYPLEPQWATRLLRRNMLEYAASDRIYVSSRYALQSFVEEGFQSDELELFPLTPHPRFSTSERRSRAGGAFDIVYVGALTVHKGVPLLIDAMSRLAYTDIRLLLVGGPKTRGMRRFLQACVARDPRIVVCPGDPLERLRDAALHVHPAYEDGFAYAPAEALACGVPVIVSEDTGMKELIASEREGVVVQTGSRDALSEAIAAAYRGEILAG
jgi:glycosyltransferase involved in cell wall biosynthesis